MLYTHCIGLIIKPHILCHYFNTTRGKNYPRLWVKSTKKQSALKTPGSKNKRKKNIWVKNWTYPLLGLIFSTKKYLKNWVKLTQVASQSFFIFFNPAVSRVYEIRQKCSRTFLTNNSFQLWQTLGFPLNLEVHKRDLTALAEFSAQERILPSSRSKGRCGWEGWKSFVKFSEPSHISGVKNIHICFPNCKSQYIDHP